MAAAMLTIPDCVDEIGLAVQLHRQVKKVPLGSWQRGKVLVGAKEQGGEPSWRCSCRFPRRGLRFVVKVQKLYSLQERMTSLKTL